MAIVCGVVATLTAVVTVCAQLLRAFVLDSAADRAAIKAGETAKLVAEREAADRHHKKLCTQLEATANSLDDLKPLREQADLWRNIVHQMETLESSWKALRDAVRKAEYTAARRHWAGIRRLGKRVAAQVPHEHLNMKSIVAAVEAHPLVAFRSGQNKKLSKFKSEDVTLPLKANMHKLGAGTRNLK
jgi:hypothetical protein